MTTDRCPACGAAVAPSVPWCTLCYADLRPQPDPAPEPVPEPVSARVPEPVSVGANGAYALAPAPAPAPAAATLATMAGPSWPCFGCGARMPMSADACSQCGRPFLPADTTPSLSLPGVGNVSSLDRTQRVLLSVGGVFGVMVVLVGLAFLLGSL